MIDDFPPRLLGDQPRYEPERRRGRYYAEGGRVLWKDDRGARVVTSALTVSGRELEAFERAREAAKEQRKVAEGIAAAKQWERENDPHAGLTVDP